MKAALISAKQFVFPVHTGVNRRSNGPAGLRTSLPRAHGGEPWIESVKKVVVEFATASSSYQKFSLWLKPSDQKDHDKAMLLLNAIGVPRDTPIDDNLKGRFVALETAQASKNGAPVLEKDGRRRIYINGISRSTLEIQHPQAKAERNPQTAAGRVATAKGEEAGEADDIPF